MVKQHSVKAPLIELSTRQDDLLLKERQKHSISNQLRDRIDIIRLANAGESTSAIARELSMTPKSVRKWRKNWFLAQQKLQSFEQGKSGKGVSDLELCRYMLTILKDAARSGSPKKFKASEEQQIIALACDKPKHHGIQMTTWTHEMLAKVAIAKNIVPSISSSQIGRLLKNTPTSTDQIRVLAIS